MAVLISPFSMSVSYTHLDVYKRQVMAFLSILILAALVVLIISMIRRITRPLADISGRMQDFSRGDLRGDIQVWGKDEIGRLADSIRSSTRSLKDMIGDISHILEMCIRDRL